MAYIISEDTRELLKDVKDFSINEIKEQVKEYDLSGEWPAEIYDKIIEMQLNMMDIPEEYGGLGLSYVDHAALLEQIAWADAGVATTLGATGLALKPVLIAGTDEQKRTCCDLIANGGWGPSASPSRTPAATPPAARPPPCWMATSTSSTAASALSPTPPSATSSWSPP